MSINHIRANSGSISAFVKGRPITIPADHRFYDRILDAIRHNDEDEFVRLADMKEGIISTFTDESGNSSVTIENGQIFYKGTVLHNVVTERILDFIENRLPHLPLVRFLENLMLNPSSRSVRETYSFLEHKRLPITEDGCFLAYKKVNADWKDYYSGLVDNSVGQRPNMERNVVDDNWHTDCSSGFHVGSVEYVSTFNSHLEGHYIVVKVNPKDVVSVPGNEVTKMRVCEYYVQEEMEVKVLEGLTGNLYRAEDDNPLFEITGPDDEDEDEDEDRWEDDEDEETDDDDDLEDDESDSDEVREWCARNNFDVAYLDDPKVEQAIDNKDAVAAIQYLYALTIGNGDSQSQAALESYNSKQDLITIIEG